MLCHIVACGLKTSVVERCVVMIWFNIQLTPESPTTLAQQLCKRKPPFVNCVQCPILRHVGSLGHHGLDHVTQRSIKLTTHLLLKANDALFQTMWGATVLDLVVVTRKNLTDVKGRVGFKGP